jgi:hypothetical protein
LNENSEDDSACKRKKNRKRPIIYIAITAIFLLTILGSLVFLTPIKSLKDLMELISLPDDLVVSDTLTISSPKPSVDSSLFAGINSTASAVIDSTQTQPQYFIIIASLTKEKEAEGMLNYFISKGMDNAKIICSDGKYRVSIDNFTNKEDAVSFLNSIKKELGNPLLKDAWILENTGQ